MCALGLAGCPELPPAVRFADDADAQGRGAEAQPTARIASEPTPSAATTPAGAGPGAAPADGSANAPEVPQATTAATPAPGSPERSSRPPSRLQATELLEALLSDPAPSSRVQVLVVDDDGCLDALAREAKLVARLPEGVRFELGPEGDAVTSSTPTDEGFDALERFLGGFRMPPGRSLLFSRIYVEQDHVGWLAVCVAGPPLIGQPDLVREKDATSLTFGLTERARERVMAERPKGKRVAFTVDGVVLLAVAPLSALQDQPEPTFTLFRK